MEALRPGDPRRIGPYRLEARLGQGGMGRVFLGVSPGGRRVAVKAIEAAHAEDPAYRRRFAREIASARRVGGFHTAQVVDADPDAPEPWLATAYIPGPSLRRLVDERGPLAGDDLRALAAGLAEGLAAIHACGLVHRDLKPENVLMAEDGPRIIDFGVARATDATSLTSHGVVVGTYASMAPEQVLAGPAGPPADVFSLGCVLAFAATGRGPFDAPTLPAIVHRVLNDAPELGGVPEPLRALVAVCLAKDPAARPTVGQVLAHLTDPDGGALPTPSLAALLTTPAEAAPATPAEAAPAAPADAAPATATDATAAERTLAERTVARPATMVAPADAVSAPATAQSVAVRRRALLVGGGAALATAALGGSAALLLGGSDGAKDTPKSRTPRLVSFTQPTAALAGHTQGVRSVAFSPDGRFLASGSGDSTVIVWDVTAGRAVHTLRGHTSAVLAVAYSPDGRTVASSALDGTVRLWDATTGTPRQILPTDRYGVSGLAYSPDGHYLAGCNPDVRIWDAATGRRLRTLTGSGNAGVDDVAFSQDGRTVAAVTDGFYKKAPGSSVLMYDPATGRRTGTLTGHRDSVHALAFVPGGRTLVSGGNEGIVRIWDYPSGRTTATVDVGGGVIHGLAATPDGRTLVVGCADRTVRLFDLATRAPAGTLTGPSSEIESVRTAPDGALVAAGSGTGSDADTNVYLWKVR
ncbi:serine/threonine protein kinase [Actinomadura logoneensis]|uniref:Serine/threonine protein kinase n=1 Tax=Actinomadura logoneensis TaxID=2293572 RepID=A0A372JNX4_9ACTN|nr:serine/threonine-protein kinase [Actinomadura logoneensis]RFU41454.1 serine/threonine protein kinase [Actinomadura logoneensis]